MFLRAHQHHGGADFMPIAERADYAGVEIDRDNQLASRRRAAFVPEPVAVTQGAFDRRIDLITKGLLLATGVSVEAGAAACASMSGLAIVRAAGPRGAAV
jgi:hypothetical protein